MAPPTTLDSPTAGADDVPLETPSADDLLALVPDMELLETSAVDALAAHVALAASASGRKTTAAPVLIATKSVSAARLPIAKPVISDDPYADLMPDLESDAQTAPVPKAIPSARPLAAASAPPVKAPPVARPIGTAPARPRPAQAPPAAAATVTAKQPPAAEAVAIPPVMDRDYIVRNRIVELYMAGRLPVRGATMFERFCHQNPQILDEIGLPERVHAGLRLLDASGKPEPWQEKPKAFWERPYVPLGLAVAVLVLGSGTLALKKQLSDQTHKVDALKQLVAEQPLDAAAATSTIDLQPTHAGAAAAIAATIGGPTAQMVNIKIDESHSEYRAFRLTIDRVDQGRVAVLNNLTKDSNNELGFSLNTSALGADTYQLTIEGLDWRGDPQPDSWAAITIKH